MLLDQNYTLRIVASNNFTVLNRIVNVLNRRRVRIKNMVAHEDKENIHYGEALILIHTHDKMVIRVKHQLEKLIEVETVDFFKGHDNFYTWVKKNYKLKSKE